MYRIQMILIFHGSTSGRSKVYRSTFYRSIFYKIKSLSVLEIFFGLTLWNCYLVLLITKPKEEGKTDFSRVRIHYSINTSTSNADLGHLILGTTASFYFRRTSSISRVNISIRVKLVMDSERSIYRSILGQSIKKFLSNSDRLCII